MQLKSTTQRSILTLRNAARVDNWLLYRPKFCHSHLKLLAALCFGRRRKLVFYRLAVCRDSSDCERPYKKERAESHD